jgi:hypothetical protein
MTRPFVVACVVEGYGEVEALPVLVRRIVESIAPDRWVDVRRPIRVNRGTMLKEGQLERYVELAARSGGQDAAVMVVVDADDDCAAEFGPELQERARSQRPDVPTSVVLAVAEFEAWFLAAAASLGGSRGLPAGLTAPPDAEGIRDAKGWLRSHRVDGLSYAPTVDQPALAARMSLAEARAGAPSFDKLWREIERLVKLTAG